MCWAAAGKKPPTHYESGQVVTLKQPVAKVMALQPSDWYTNDCNIWMLF
jgi:hypothetical protein